MNDSLCFDFEAWVRQHHARSERALERLLPQEGRLQRRLLEAIRYATLGGGKRLRPLLCYAAGTVTGASADTLDVVGGALEMIHVSSHVHDDLPPMDDDPVRRGRPSVHLQYDEATAILVGDALLAQAFLVLTDAAVPATCQGPLVRELADAVGTAGLSGGQSADLCMEGRQPQMSELREIHRMKTGVLIRASLRMGALCGISEHGRVTDAGIFSALERYADATGLAFQVVDDVLDAQADARAGKTTWASMLGVEAACALAESLRAEAYEALRPLGSRGWPLQYLTGRVVDCIQGIH
ncbi:hypothetical protein WM23_03940 [Burkholderia ubonensis]|nr:hypothetical protein WM23_03940 [Burkholderia ubonensis]